MKNRLNIDKICLISKLIINYYDKIQIIFLTILYYFCLRAHTIINNEKRYLKNINSSLRNNLQQTVSYFINLFYKKKY